MVNCMPCQQLQVSASNADPCTVALLLQARDFYQQFLDRVRKEYAADKIKDGVFGAYMSVQLENDGPVTYILDSESDL